MPRGLNRSGDFRRGNPVNWVPSPAHFGNRVNWETKPVGRQGNPEHFGNPVNTTPDPKNFGNPVTWVPAPNHYGNPVGGNATTPTFTPVAGSYGVPQIVKIISNGADAIYYTTDGTTPDATSRLYMGSVIVPSSQTIKAIAYVNGVASGVGTAAYVIS